MAISRLKSGGWPRISAPCPSPTTRTLLRNLRLQPDHLLPGIRGDVVEAVLVVHVEDQHRGAVVLDQARQEDARQEGFARAGRAEDPRRALHEAAPG